MQRSILIFSLLFLPMITTSQDTIMPLWPKEKIPNRIASDEKEEHMVQDLVRIDKVQEPTIEVYLPSKKNVNGQAVLIFPG